ncbi:MAG: hypothetical protein LBQ13_04685 [Endomicrobium sp.]|jgi:hypothetical protein|nr:hypothetical protein [Endomicrobium sp.]
MSKIDISKKLEEAKKSVVSTPKQKVIPVPESREKEVPLGILVPEEFRKFVKMVAAREGVSIKEMVMTAISEKYNNGIL